MRVLTILMLAVLLSACNLFGGPSFDVIRRAIADQVESSQQRISTQIYTTSYTVPFSIQRIRVSATEPTQIHNQTAFHVIGQYDVEFHAKPHSTVQKNNVFDVYVLQSREDESWWLARPDIPITSDVLEWKLSPL